MDDDAYFDSTLDLELYMARTPDADHGGPLSHASAQDMEALNQRLGHGVARLGDTGAAAYLTESKSPPAISYPAAQMHAAAPTVGDGGGDKSKSLGVWRFDKKKKKRFVQPCRSARKRMSLSCIYVAPIRVYVSLTGERLEGRRAFSRQREDQLVETYSSHSVRSQLVQVPI